MNLADDLAAISDVLDRLQASSQELRTLALATDNGSLNTVARMTDGAIVTIGVAAGIPLNR